MRQRTVATVSSAVGLGGGPMSIEALLAPRSGGRA